MTQYSIFVLGQLVAWIWAERVLTGDQYNPSGNPEHLWFEVQNQYGDFEVVGSLDIRPGVEVKVLGDDQEWTVVTPDSIRNATQKESSGTAQTAVPSEHEL